MVQFNQLLLTWRRKRKNIANHYRNMSREKIDNAGLFVEEKKQRTRTLSMRNLNLINGIKRYM